MFPRIAASAMTITCFEGETGREDACARRIFVGKREAHRIVRMFCRHHIIRVRLHESDK